MANNQKRNELQYDMLRSVVVVELRKGQFKPSHLGQLAAYLRIDDGRMVGVISINGESWNFFHKKQYTRT